jgi:hypothetical protein
VLHAYDLWMADRGMGSADDDNDRPVVRVDLRQATDEELRRRYMAVREVRQLMNEDPPEEVVVMRRASNWHSALRSRRMALENRAKARAAEDWERAHPMGALPRLPWCALAENIIRAGQAAWWYSLRMPPKRGRRRMSSWLICAGSVIGFGSGWSGRSLAMPWWGRWLL